MSTSFDIEVRAGLEQRRGDWRHLATSAGVSYSWISQFVRQKIPNPGYATLVKLRRALDRPDEVSSSHGAHSAPADTGTPSP